MTRRFSPDRIAVALLTLVVLIVFFDVLFLGNGLVRADLFHYHYPMKKIVRDAIFSGEFPWWNRLYSGGQPMAANPAYEIFYPGQWPILIGSYRFGFNLHIILHVWLAAVGMFLLLRTLDLGTAASLLGAASFGLSGLFFGFLSTLPICFVWTWAPLAFLFLVRFRRYRQQRDFALAALVLGVQLLVGEPVSLLQMWILIAAAVIWDLVRSGEQRCRRTVSSIVVIVALFTIALGVAAVQIIPAIDHVRDTSRARGLNYHSVVQYSSAPGRAVELLAPHFYGHHIESGAYFWGVASQEGAPYVFSIYIGLLAAVAVIASMVGMPREAVPVVLFCGFWYVIAVGHHTPLFDALYDLGIATAFRYPEKFLALAVAPLVCLAAAMFDRFVTGERRAVLSMLAVSAVVALATLAAAVISYLPAYRRWFIDHWKLLDSKQTDVLVRLSQRDWTTASIYAFCLLLLLAAGARRRTVAWLIAVAIFVAADLHRVVPEISLRMPRRFFDAPGIASALKEARRGYTVFHIGDWYTEALNPKFFQTGDQHYWIARNALLPPTAAAWGLRSALERDYDETYLLPTREILSAMMFVNRMGIANWWQPFAAISNVRYVLDYRDFDLVAAECRGNFSVSRPVSARQARTDYPRYYFATELISAPDWRSVVRSMRERGVVPGVAFVRIPPFAPARARILGVSESASRATIDVEAAGNSFLVMTVTPHRYWRAAIDGSPAHLERANIAYQGIVVPTGHHTIEMRYRNPLVVIGGIISTVTLLTLCVAIFGGVSWKKPAI